MNVTPIGMAGGPEEHDRPSAPTPSRAADVVFDVVAMPAETPLIRAAREAGIPVITGAEVIAAQAAEQFERYTGVRPSTDRSPPPPRSPARSRRQTRRPGTEPKRRAGSSGGTASGLAALVFLSLGGDCRVGSTLNRPRRPALGLHSWR